MVTSHALVPQACEEHGFFYLTGHGIPDSTVDGIRGHASRFFALPDADKNAISISNSPSFRGYQRLGENVTYASDAGRPLRDWHEAIDTYREEPPDGKIPTNFGYNQYPSEALCPGFASASREYVNEMLSLGNDVMRCVAASLDLENDYFAPYYERSFWVMRMIRYPSSDEPRDEGFDPTGTGCGEHTDYGCLTFVNQPLQPTGCLQVRAANGSWVDADPIPGCFVVNIGDMLSRWTNGLFRSTAHRVLHPESGAGDRVSVPFFFEPNYDAVVEPLPHLGEPRFEPVAYGSHLLAKSLANFAPVRGSE